MSNQIPSYRITKEDLKDLDKKTYDGLEPLIEALNNTLGQIVALLNSAPTTDIRQVTFTTKTGLIDSFPLVFNTTVTKPRAVLIGQVIAPSGTDVSVGISPIWNQLANGNISVSLISGLVPETRYQITFIVM